VDARERPNLTVWALAAGLVILQLACGGRYGLFRDEYYYLACAERLDWGYVDHPPLSIAVLALVRALLGDGLLAVRLVPALLGGALVLLAARLARELGGGAFAQVLAALAVVIAPQYLVLSGFYSMNAFDLVCWALAALLVARLANGAEERLWLLVGLVLGLGLLNKISVLFFGAGLAAGLLLTPLRRHLARPWIWLGGLIAAALFAPHVLWQVRHGWPTLEFIRNAQERKIVALGPLEFVLAQLPEIHPLNALVWLPGLFFLLVSRAGRPWRVLGIVYVTALLIFAVQHSKPYYLGPAYPMLLAAGGVAWEAWSQAGRRAWLRPALGALLALGGAAVAPLVVPLLPVEGLVAYQRALGAEPSPAENHRLGPLPQHFADRFGWREMTDAVARAYTALPAHERGLALIVTSNYGEAGALNYHGRTLGLPRAVSQHNNFYLWGPGRADARVVITVGIPADDLAEAFESVLPVARFESPWAMPYETRHAVHVCRGLRLPLDEAWRRGKNFI
jgi:hypothetical protein